MKKVFIGFFVFVVVFIFFGNFAPRYIIFDGINQYTGEDKRFASYALHESGLFVGGSLEPFFLTQMRVTNVVANPTDKKECDSWPPGDENAKIIGEYKAKIELFTYFGIPYGELAVSCDQIVRTR